MLDWGGCVYEWVGPGESRALRLVPAPGVEPTTVIDVMKKTEEMSAEAKDEEILKTKNEIAEIKGELARRELEVAKSNPKPKAKMIVVDLSDDEKEDDDEWVIPGDEEDVGDNGRPGDEEEKERKELHTLFACATDA